MLQIEEVKAKEAEIRGLDQAAAEREAKILSLETDIDVLGAQVADLPPPGDAGEFNGQRQQLLAELRDVVLQVSRSAGEGRQAARRTGCGQQKEVQCWNCFLSHSEHLCVIMH